MAMLKQAASNSRPLLVSPPAMVVVLPAPWKMWGNAGSRAALIQELHFNKPYMWTTLPPGSSDGKLPHTLIACRWHGLLGRVVTCCCCCCCVCYRAMCQQLGYQRVASD